MNQTVERDAAFKHNRKIGRWLNAAFDGRQYRGVIAATSVCVRPVDFLRRYAGAPSHYPASVKLRTPTGQITLDLYSWHDARTIHEIFLAEDYQIGTSKSVIVDYGSNIGVSAAYFLSRNRGSFAYLFEPVPKNVDRLRKNLHQFEGRFQVQQVAVGLGNGNIQFGTEESGRYGGIHRETGEYISVACRDSNEILAEIVANHGAIDVLKIDVETMERDLVEHLTPDLASKVRLLFVEAKLLNLLAPTHITSMQGTVTRFQLKP
jgi:FkbM family methyltransferase